MNCKLLMWQPVIKILRTLQIHRRCLSPLRVGEVIPTWSNSAALSSIFGSAGRIPSYVAYHSVSFREKKRKRLKKTTPYSLIRGRKLNKWSDMNWEATSTSRAIYIVHLISLCQLDIYIWSSMRSIQRTWRSVYRYWRAIKYLFLACWDDKGDDSLSWT